MLVDPALRRAAPIRAVAVFVPLTLLLVCAASSCDVSSTAVEDDIDRLYAAQRSDVVVEGHGVVDRILSDDLEGSRHQRFILRLDSGHTLLISHNIDLASRIARIGRGDEVSFRGQYEWNEKGGVVHWTHHDPKGQRSGGWLRHEGQIYR